MLYTGSTSGSSAYISERKSSAGSAAPARARSFLGGPPMLEHAFSSGSSVASGTAIDPMAVRNFLLSPGMGKYETHRSRTWAEASCARGETSQIPHMCTWAENSHMQTAASEVPPSVKGDEASGGNDAQPASTDVEAVEDSVNDHAAGIPIQLLHKFATDLPHAIQWFELHDTNQDGMLTLDEFARGLSVYGIAADGARSLFEVIRKPHAEAIELHELIDIASNIREKRADALKHSDVDHHRSKPITEYILSFLWRSVPNLAAETRTAAESIKDIQGLQPLGNSSEYSEDDAGRGAGKRKPRRKSVAEMEGVTIEGLPGGQATNRAPWHKFMNRVSSGDAIRKGAFGTPNDSLGSPSADEHARAAIMKHAIAIERSLGRSEAELFGCVEKVVSDVESIAERIRQFRLRMLLAQATHRKATRMGKTASMIADHYAFTDMLWRSLMGSLARLRPLQQRGTWEKIAPFPEVERNQRYAAVLCAVLLFLLLTAAMSWVQHMVEESADTTYAGNSWLRNGTNTSSSEELALALGGNTTDWRESFMSGQQPINVFLCAAHWGAIPSLSAALSIITLVMSVAIFVLLMRKNVYWIGITYGFLHPTNAVLPLISTLFRTIALLRAYTKLSRERSGASECVTVSVGLTASYFILFLTFVVSDMWRAPAPGVRLCLATIIAIYLVVEVYMRSVVTTILYENISPTGSETFDSLISMVWGGANTHDLVLGCDRTVLLLMLAAFKNTIMRPNECAMAVIPASLETIKFFFEAESENRKIHGRNRLRKLEYLWDDMRQWCSNNRRVRMLNTTTGHSFHYESAASSPHLSTIDEQSASSQPPLSSRGSRRSTLVRVIKRTVEEAKRAARKGHKTTVGGIDQWVRTMRRAPASETE